MFFFNSGITLIVNALCNENKNMVMKYVCILPWTGVFWIYLVENTVCGLQGIAELECVLSHLKGNWKSLGNYGIIYKLLSELSFGFITLDFRVSYNLLFLLSKGLLYFVITHWLLCFVLMGWGCLVSSIRVKSLV